MNSAVQVQGTLNDPTDRDTGWTLEIALPWAGLSTLRGGNCPKNGQQWRINFSRVEWDIEIINGKYHKIQGRPEHNWVWSPQYVVDMHRPAFWGYVQFSESVIGENTEPFIPDPTWETRCELMELYEAHRGELEPYPNWQATLNGLAITHDSRIFSL